MPRGRAGSRRTLVPVVLGAGALYWLARRGPGAGMLSGTIPAGRPYVQLVFEGDRLVGLDETDMAREAVRRVQSVTIQDSPAFVVVEAAEQASSQGLKSKQYATVLARVAGFLQGQPWSIALGPLLRSEGSTLSFLYRVHLVESGTAAGGTLSLARQYALAAQPANVSVGGEIQRWLDRLKTTGTVVLVLGGLTLAFLVYREIRAVTRERAA